MERRNQRGNAPYRNGRPGGKKKETTLMIVCILLVLNMVFMLMLEMQVRNINSALKQVLNRLTVTQMTGNEAEIQKEEEVKVPEPEYHAPPEETVQDRPVDYVSLCGLPEVEKPVKRTEKQVLERLKALAEDNELIAGIYENRYAYPEEMLEALANNPEMADFVSNYLTENGSVRRGADGAKLTELEKGQEYPLFLQWDPRWGYVEYGDDSNVGLAGCGPTCLSMVLYYLLGNEGLTPDKIAEYSMENGYYMAGTGTAWALLEDVATQYGIHVTQPKASEAEMKQALDAGDYIICSMGPGDFTAGGHFIVVYGYDSEGFYVNDSNCVARSREKWEFARLKKQIKNMWVYKKGMASGGNAFLGT